VPEMVIKLLKVHMSHILAFFLGMFVATYGVAETVSQLDKAFQTAKIIIHDSGAINLNR